MASKPKGGRHEEYWVIELNKDGLVQKTYGPFLTEDSADAEAVCFAEDGPQELFVVVKSLRGFRQAVEREDYI
jgi:hypothetical protein